MNEHERRQSEIFDECLGMILTGQATVEECLQRFPQDAHQLGPVLTLAQIAIFQLAPDDPRPDFVASSRKRIVRKAAQQQAQTARPRPKTGRVWRLQPARAVIGLVLAVSMLAVSTGLVQAANAALPGDALYGLKRGLERSRLAISWSAAGDISLLAQYADTRLAEVEALLAENRVGDINLALDGYIGLLDDLTAMVSDTGPDIEPDSLEQILEHMQQHQDVLMRVSLQVPETALPAIQRALERSAHSMQVIRYLRQGGNPSDLAPGHKRPPPGHQRTPPGQDRTPPGQEDGSSQDSTQSPPRNATPTHEPATETQVPSVYVNDLDAKLTGGPNKREVLVTISVTASEGGKVGGVTVVGQWEVSGPGAEDSCITLDSGKCTLTSGILSGVEETSYEVTDLIHPEMTYAPQDNSDPDDDSDGTFIRIRLID